MNNFDKDENLEEICKLYLLLLFKRKKWLSNYYFQKMEKSNFPFK